MLVKEGCRLLALRERKSHLNSVLRKLTEWKARRKAVQIIVLDGGADLEKTRSFAKGVAVGVGLTALVLALTAPTAMDAELLEEIAEREALLDETKRRAEQAMGVADFCLTTAQNMEQTLTAYQSFLGSSDASLPPSFGAD